MTKEKKENNSVERTTKGLSGVIMDEINAIRAGQSNPQQAREVCRLVNTAINIAKTEMAYARFISEQSDTKNGKLKAVEL